jgi:hypothetical protein
MENDTKIMERPSESGELGMEVRMAKLEAHVEHMQSDISEIKADLRDFRKESREDFASIRAEFAQVREKADRDFRFTFTVMATLGLGLLALIAKAFNWIS